MTYAGCEPAVSSVEDFGTQLAHGPRSMDLLGLRDNDSSRVSEIT